jgi:hypothetical protein
MAKREQAALNEASFDLRLIGREMRKNRLDTKDYEAYLKKLPDSSGNAVEIEVYEELKESPTPPPDELTFT